MKQKSEPMEYQQMATETLRIRKAESISDEIETLNDRIMRRAYELFLSNGSITGQDLDNWSAAEREMVWKPAIELHESGGQLFVNLAASGIDPKHLEIKVTAEDMLVKAEVQHEHTEDKGTVHFCEFASRGLFRAIHFPKKINPNKVKAEFRNGMLHVKAAVAEQRRARKMAAGAS